VITMKRAYEPAGKNDGSRVFSSQRTRVTLVYSAHDVEHNNAAVLKEFLEGKMKNDAKRRVAA